LAFKYLHIVLHNEGQLLTQLFNQVIIPKIHSTNAAALLIVFVENSYLLKNLERYLLKGQTLLRTATIIRMWANAQRDGRPAEYVAPSAQRRKVWLTPTTRVPCSNAAKTRSPLKFAGVPQTRQQISAVSGPKFTIL